MATPTDRQELLDLARDVIEMLRAQREYFDTRNNEVLQRSKKLERQLKATAERILVPPPAGLFDGDEPPGAA